MRSKIQHSSFVVASLLLSFFTAFSASADDVWNGYTRLTWIESTGSNWIDTGVKARSGLIVQTQMTMLSVDPNQAAFGASDADDANGIGFVTRPTITSTWNSMRVIYGAFDSVTSGTFTRTYDKNNNGPHRSTIYKFDNGYFTWGATHPSLPAVVAGDFESQANIFISWMGGPGPNGGSVDYAPAPLLIFDFNIQDKSTGAYIIAPAINQVDSAA